MSIVALACAVSASSGQLSIEHVGGVGLPGEAADQHGQPFAVTGLSGIGYLGPAGSGGADRFVAVLDNSDKLVFIDVTFRGDGSIEGAGFAGGLTVAAGGDQEGVGPVGVGLAWVSDERGMVLREHDLVDGALLRTFAMPQVFGERRANLGLESLAANGSYLWTANEEALRPDGGRSSPDEGTVVRIARLRESDGAALAQHAYVVEPMHGPIIPFGNPGQSGLCDLVALPDGSMLALERSLAFTSPLFLTRVFLIGSTGLATDVSDRAGLDGEMYTPVAKTLLYEGGHTNLEGLCLGPRLGGGGHSLVGIVDDGDPVSENALVVFRLHGLAACPADLDGNGVVDIEDLHALHGEPRDLNGDGTADARDIACLTAYLRRHERLDMESVDH